MKADTRGYTVCTYRRTRYWPRRLRRLEPATPSPGAILQSAHSRDLALMKRNWDGSPEAAMDNPLGGIKRGWSEIRQTYERLFGAPGTYSFEFWDFTLHQSGDVFWVVGRERGQVTKGNEAFEPAIRTTRLFRRADGRWRQIHHHGSIEDPDMLARYLAMVRKAN